MSDDPVKLSMREAKAKLRQELAETLGYFALEFAEMEGRINEAIHALLNLAPDTGHALTAAIMNLSTRLDILKTLTRDLDIPSLERGALDGAISQAIALNTYRNWILHDPWSGLTVKTGEPELRHAKAKMLPSGSKQLRQWTTRTYSISEMRAETSKCATLVSQLKLIARNLRQFHATKDTEK